MKVALPLLLFGYMLIYAAVAAGGVFADNPWRGFTEDAYEVTQQAEASGRGSRPWWKTVLNDLFGIVPEGGLIEAVGTKILGIFGL